jgi:hypothetical protein
MDNNDDDSDNFIVTNNTYEFDLEHAVFPAHHKYFNELEFEKLKLKFSKAFIKYINNIKSEPDYYEHVYKEFFILWKKISVERQNISLFELLKYLTKSNPYMIKKSIFDTVSNDKLKDKLYLKFINDFININQ